MVIPGKKLKTCVLSALTFLMIITALNLAELMGFAVKHLVPLPELTVAAWSAAVNTEVLAICAVVAALVVRAKPSDLKVDQVVGELRRSAGNLATAAFLAIEFALGEVTLVVLFPPPSLRPNYAVGISAFVAMVALSAVAYLFIVYREKKMEVT